MAVSSSSDASRQSRKRQQTSVHIVSVAFALFDAHGYDNVSMEQIAAAADVAKRTLYNHFPVKEALVRHRFHADLSEHLPGVLHSLKPEMGCEARLRALFREVAACSLGCRDYMPHYIHYRLGRSLDRSAAGERSGMVEIFKSLLADGQRDGDIKADRPVERLAENLQFMFLSTLLLWIDRSDEDLLMACDDMVDLFLHGCATRGPA